MSLSSAHDDRRLYELAQEQLTVSPPHIQPIPPHYIAELRRHVRNHPFDTHFRVLLQPGRGFGIVNCLEDTCIHQSIPLTKRSSTSVPDGGISSGFGSLTAYRTHVSAHPTHQIARNRRVEAMAVENIRPVINAPPGNMRIVKAESCEGLITAPVKRVKREDSEPFLTARPAYTQSGLPASPKRLKLEAPASSSPYPSNHAMNAEVASPRTSVKFLTAQLRQVKANLMDKQIQFSMKQRMGQPIHALERDIADLNRKLISLQVQITSGRPRRLESDNYEPVAVDPNWLEWNPMSLGISTPTNAPPSIATPTSRLIRPLPRRVSLKPESSPSLSPKRDYSSDILDESEEEFYLPGDPWADRNIDDDSGDGSLMDTDDEMNRPNPMDIVNLVVASGAVPYVAPARNADAYDSNGDYFGRGRDAYVGPQAAPSDFNAFVKMAGSKEQFDQDATVEKSMVLLGLQDRQQKMKHMTITLMDHQIIGVAWMVAKEKTTMKGGILGDDMGLGKTVQMIATMVTNRSDDPLCKTNLILAPMALLEQWKQEIETKSDCDMKCLIYHGPGKAKIKNPKQLLKYDIVLTTYSTMALEWPDLEAEAKAQAKAKRRRSNDGFLVSDSDEDIKPIKKAKKQKGLLFQTEFYRIILDEAHNIRNKRTRASRAVSELQSKYHWVLTGTIIVNTIVDVYACLRFIRIRPWYDWAEFNEHIGLLEKKRPDLAATRLQAILATCHLRRLKTTMMHGRPLIQLPPKDIELVRLEFTAEERNVYDMVEKQSQAAFNRFLRAGAVLKNYHNILVLLLRLRQICSHPSLIQEDGGAFIEADEACDENVQEDLREDISRARRLISPDFVRKLRERYKAAALAAERAEKENVLEATVAEGSEECSICLDLISDPVVAACTHEFCRRCIEEVLEAPQDEQQASETIQRYTAQERPCPCCRSPISKEKLFRRAAFQPTEADLRPQPVEVIDSSEDEKPVITRKKANSKKKAVMETDDEDMATDHEHKATPPPPSSPARRSTRSRNVKPIVISDGEDNDGDEYTEEMDDFIVPDDHDESEALPRRGRPKKRAMAVYDSDDSDALGGKEQVIFGVKKKIKMTTEQMNFVPRFLPSTKMKHMMEVLLKLQREKPDQKTIVVSQWTSCLKLVSDYLTENSIPHVKYQGNMHRNVRDKAVKLFMANDKARVMLMSLKCGGVGLNLTRANNLITLDLAWSQAIERQAFDRIHRMGQQREVKISRLVVERTVEDRILALQERKQNIADGSLGEGAGKKIGRLTVAELANLFGLDARGRVLDS